MSDNITLTKGHLEEAMDLVKGDRIQIFVLKQARLIVQTGGGGERGPGGSTPSMLMHILPKVEQ